MMAKLKGKIFCNVCSFLHVAVAVRNDEELSNLSGTVKIANIYQNVLPKKIGWYLIAFTTTLETIFRVWESLLVLELYIWFLLWKYYLSEERLIFYTISTLK